MAKPPEMPLQKGQTKCTTKASQNKPLIVEWSGDQRSDLEALARRPSGGLVAVRYVGCEMEVLSQCSADGRYGYVAVTPKEDHLSIRDEDSLYASMPMSAAKLAGKLEERKQLDVQMTVVGKYQADQTSVRKNQLKGRCDGATHVVTGITAGAFEFTAGADMQSNAEVSAGGVGVGGARKSSKEILRTDGTTAACAGAKVGDVAPPNGCGALLKIEVIPLDDDASVGGTQAGQMSPASPPAPSAVPLKTCEGTMAESLRQDCRRCAAGIVAGCTAFGVYLYRGTGIAQDVARGKALIEQACRARDDIACRQMCLDWNPAVCADLCRRSPSETAACDAAGISK